MVSSLFLIETISSYSSVACFSDISFDIFPFARFFSPSHLNAGLNTHPKPPDANTFPPIFFIIYIYFYKKYIKTYILNF